MSNLAKLFLFFLAAALLVSFVITPSLLFAFDANKEHIIELQEQSNKLGSDAKINPETLQNIVTEGAKKIKNQLNDTEYLFIYCSQVAYNLLCFLICGLIYRKITFSPEIKKQDWTKIPPALYFLTPVLLMSSLPIIGETLHLNDLLGIDWLLEQTGLNLNKSSVGNMIFSYAVFVPETKLQLLTSIIFVAIIPAVGEELFFRGSLQKTLSPLLGNIHNTIFITAFIFSALHFEITAFFYRFFLGVMLGYVYFWSKNLLVPILIHALNNGMTAFAMYYTFNADSAINIDPSTGSEKIMTLALSGITAGVVLWIYYLNYRRQEQKT